MKYKEMIYIGAFAGLISALLPSLPTTYWMWKERKQYRWILIAVWLLVIFIIIFLVRRTK